jgi:hypothetical protein
MTNARREHAAASVREFATHPSGDVVAFVPDVQVDRATGQCHWRVSELELASDAVHGVAVLDTPGAASASDEDWMRFDGDFRCFGNITLDWSPDGRRLAMTATNGPIEVRW